MTIWRDGQSVSGNRRSSTVCTAVVIGKGGHRETVVWASGTARLLPRYLDGRRRGPVFMTKRQPNVVPADRGRGRAVLVVRRGRWWSI